MKKKFVDTNDKDEKNKIKGFAFVKGKNEENIFNY